MKYLISLLRGSSIVLIIAVMAASGRAQTPLNARGPGKSMLHTFHGNFANCYTWFGVEFEGSSPGGPPKRMGQETSGCTEVIDRNVSKCRYPFQGNGFNGLCPEFYLQTSDLVPGERNPARTESGFIFDIYQSQFNRQRIPTFRLYNEGRRLGSRSLGAHRRKYCARQKEISLSMFGGNDEQIVTKSNGSAYRLSEMKTITLDFDAKVVLGQEICGSSGRGLSIFKPSLLFDLLDASGKRVSQNSIIFDIAVRGKFPKEGKVDPKSPEVLLFNQCVNKAFPGFKACTVHVSDSVFRKTTLGNGWYRYRVDVKKLIDKYKQGKYIQGNDNRSVIRTLQFIATQQGGMVDARIRNINLRISR